MDQGGFPWWSSGRELWSVHRSRLSEVSATVQSERQWPPGWQRQELVALCLEQRLARRHAAPRLAARERAHREVLGRLVAHHPRGWSR